MSNYISLSKSKKFFSVGFDYGFGLYDTIDFNCRVNKSIRMHSLLQKSVQFRIFFNITMIGNFLLLEIKKEIGIKTMLTYFIIIFQLHLITFEENDIKDKLDIDFGETIDNIHLLNDKLYYFFKVFLD